MSQQTIGQSMTRKARRDLTDQVAERNYGGGYIFAPIQFKADDQGDDPEFMRPVKFEGFANTGHPDLGHDIVDPSAFTKATIKEFLTYGRQLLFMHDMYSQVGEITGAEMVMSGKRSIVGNRMGGLRVQGIVDSPFDKDMMIPDHPLAKVIHFARMQVQKGRLKALSIGWQPVKTSNERRRDQRTGKDVLYRMIKQLILREVSLVTFAMNPQSMIQLRKAMTSAYGDDVTEALFCDDPVACNVIPEKVDDFTFDRIRDLVIDSAVKAAQRYQPEGSESDNETDKASEPTQQSVKLVSLDDKPAKPVKIVTLFGG